MKISFLIGLCFALSACDADGRLSHADYSPSSQAETAPQETASSSAQGKIYSYKVIGTYPHDTGSFTQGLFVADGELYETTGKVGRSKLIRHSILSAQPALTKALPRDIFGEGAVAVGDKIISLTWHAGVGYIHDLHSLEKTGSFTFEGQGWGLTYDGTRLIMSDGSSELRFLDPVTYAQTGSLPVTVNGNPLFNLNELEWIEGEIWANVWQQDVIVRIDPASGHVVSMIDMRGLHDARLDTDDVLNGIAYDPASRRLFVTGKRWPEIYEIELTQTD